MNPGDIFGVKRCTLCDLELVVVLFVTTVLWSSCHLKSVMALDKLSGLILAEIKRLLIIPALLVEEPLTKAVVVEEEKIAGSITGPAGQTQVKKVNEQLFQLFHYYD